MADTMRKKTSLLLLSFFLLQCLTNTSSISNSVYNHTPSGSVTLAVTISSGRGPWCLPLQGLTSEELQANIQEACRRPGRADCSPIQKGGPCYLPDTLFGHASYAMNAYYYANGKKENNCYFNATATFIWKDPSYENCVYPS
ncbi:glucan endo-1,3-beta-glucosidase 7-like [Zingiber officinale]|uniref:glucan endo-1,3-beta-glucosidase 7-like n=1 Tax=Zingiber officinale TaxID=94328 RepID=UPI001C4C1939|nr:glucan endo-1,3-beta-glucosidase 7-like [Zingiber officinale]